MQLGDDFDFEKTTLHIIIILAVTSCLIYYVESGTLWFVEQWNIKSEHDANKTNKIEAFSFKSRNGMKTILDSLECCAANHQLIIDHFT
ncbi:CLUMA_CG010228, isoform A [Clunio marinus]|uniref:CLUMA_CG010228, isoform A n=1 Tax=Clunio marinus TaxID=568069 RepID=A0A1J1I8C0_9DIPT|nr:CLUMA_CG010228, isoform A [Clunio marinus]